MTEVTHAGTGDHDPGGDDAAYELVCALTDLTVGEPAQAQVGDRVVALVRTAESEVHCVDDTCSHAEVSLSEGEVRDCTIECWLHGSMFDLRTGDPSGPPATVPVAVYPVRVQDGDVYVSPRPAFTSNES